LPGTYNTYRKLRKVIGILGMSLPVLLVVLAPLLKSWHEGVPIHWELERSISAYYYTKAGGLFVGTLFAIGVLLLSYNYRVLDTILTTIACGLAITVALCPTPEFSGQVNLLGILHYLGASGLFFTFGFMALLRFTKSDISPPDKNWENRTRLYQACGAVIFAMLGVAFVLWVAERLTGSELVLPILNNNWLFWVEVVMVEAFGLSWLVKGGSYFFGPLKALWAPPLGAGDKTTSDAVRRRLPGLVLADAAAKQN
jgi:hypothetical protein